MTPDVSSRRTSAAKRAGRSAERQSQFTLQMRESLRQELARRALESGMTMRGFIMNALRKAGLNVTEDDLVDRRRRDR
ncbi:MAG: hypothetical protein RIC89_02440 [Pseudomonadales bacterium]